MTRKDYMKGEPKKPKAKPKSKKAAEKEYLAQAVAEEAVAQAVADEAALRERVRFMHRTEQECAVVNDYSTQAATSFHLFTQVGMSQQQAYTLIKQWWDLNFEPLPKN